MGILLALAMCILAALAFAVKREYKMAIIFITAIIGVALTLFMWYFTRLPYSLNLKHTPKIEFVQIRNATKEEIKYFSNDVNHPLYIVEFSANMRLDRCRRSQYCFYCSPTEQEFNYDTITRNKDKDMVFFVSHDVMLANETDSTCIYYVPIQFLSLSHDSSGLLSSSAFRIEDIKSDLRCKVFFIGVLEPVLSTSEMVIPMKNLQELQIE